MNEMSRLVAISRPEDILRRRARPVVLQHQAWRLRAKKLVIPGIPPRQHCDQRWIIDGIVLRGSLDAVEERLERLLRRLLVAALIKHAEPDGIAPLDNDLLAPIAIEEALTIERERS